MPPLNCQIVRSARDAQLRVIQLQNQVDSLNRDNELLRGQITSNDPMLRRYAGLSRKIITMESRAEEREQELRRVVDCNREETRRLQVLHDEELREKNEKIRVFRSSLSRLLSDVRKLAVSREAEKHQWSHYIHKTAFTPTL